MRYGLFGAHRSGKTTLAEASARVLGIDFLPIKTTEVAKRYGYDPVRPMSLKDRVELQHILLHDFMKTTANAPPSFICDRTPLDHAVYLLAELNMRSGDELSENTIAACVNFVEAAVDITAKTFDMIYYLQPLAHYAVDPTKPPENAAYHLHYQMVALGLLMQHSSRISWGNVPTLPLDERVTAVTGIIAQRMATIQQTRRASIHLH